MKWKNLLVGLLALVGMEFALAASSLTIPMYLVDEQGPAKSIGTIKAEEGISGVLFTPDLHSLPPGEHGFHLHEHSSCDNGAMAAGGHFDPDHSGKHRGPFQTNGHLGDLPLLIVNREGRSTLPLLAPRFKLSDLPKHALVIHVGSDNYSDTPEKLGGGGARIACGVIQ